jgi:uncharacterized protein (DUF1800 family)
MNPALANIPPLSRRTALQVTAASLFSWGAAGRGHAQGAGSSPTGTADLWRAVSRVGYGPSAALLRTVQAAASPRAWAVQQIDLAFTASQSPPRLAADLTDFNAPLPRIFEGARAEREARAKTKATAGSDTNTAASRRMDFSGPRAPEHFSKTMEQQAAVWRLTSSSQPELENPLLARMTEFWFNHLNVYAGKGAVRPFTGHYLVNVARAHALGRFEDLLLASARHPAMLLYLDQARSVADGSRGPQGSTRGLNENYARELMELHTLGVDGGYTQDDVRELARVLTGWTVAPDDASGFQCVARLHDNGTKRVMGKTFPAGALSGEREGEEAIRLLASHPSTARRVCLRLAQFFVADTPSAALVKTLSQTFLATQGDIKAVMRALLQSAEFWSTESRLFKTPMDFACSALAATHHARERDTSGRASPISDQGADRRSLVLTLGFLSNAGQPLHGWQTPDGYPFSAATWLVPEALTRRADYALALARQTPALDFMWPFLGESTRNAIAQEKRALQAGLMLASPDFMAK